MATYCFKCKTCGAKWTQAVLTFGFICDGGHDHEAVRDYKEEGVAHTAVPGGYKEANRGR